jgi:hypothetical protein
MDSNLFGDVQNPEYCLDFHYQGDSFLGHIEIERLAKELTGLDTVLKLAVECLYKNGRISIVARDVELVIAPFEEGSFRKKVRVVIKNLNKNTGAYTVTIALAGLLLNLYSVIRTQPVIKILEMSPQLQAEIHDRVLVELLSNKELLKSISAPTYPLKSLNDNLIISGPDGESENFGIDEKIKLDSVSAMAEKEVITYENEVLTGRITMVNLNATVNAFGFRVNDEGVTIKTALLETMDQEEKRALLGQWVIITGQTTFTDSIRTKIDIKKIVKTTVPNQGSFNY